jgi:hypothetical protein
MRIAYVNTWGGFTWEFANDKFVMTKMLREAFPNCQIRVGVDENRDLVISLYHPMLGSPHYADISKINCKKIAFTGESYDIVATTPGCDAYIGFDREEDMPLGMMALRFPLYALYHQDYLDKYGCSTFEELRHMFIREKINKISAVVSNPSNYLRNSVIQTLVENNLCDSGGKVGNTVGEVGDKLEFSSRYVVGMAFENLPKKSYITEKIYEVFVVGSIPFYYGADNITDEFNPNSFLRLNTDGDMQMLIASIEDAVSVLTDRKRIDMMLSVDPITGYRAEKYIRNGRQIFKDFIMKVVDTK